MVPSPVGHTENFQSRSLRQRDVKGIDAFPTPPSSASTPPTTTTVTTDEPPPRKRARFNPPDENVIDLTTSNYVEDRPMDVETMPPTPEMAVRMPRIRIKMAEKKEERPVRKLTESHSEDEDEQVEMEGTPNQEGVEETWEDQEVREMVDPEENWRVIGLSNVGNTCFTNAILQVFSYLRLVALT
jgi:hypothetical protein